MPRSGEVLRSAHLSDDRAEFLINDRLSFMRFLGLGLSDRVPDAKTIWLFRERLTRADAIERLFTRFDLAIREAGYIPMSGQIVDATLVSAPKQRNSESEKKDIKAGRVPEGWRDKPAKLRQKDMDARWTIQFGKAKPRQDGTVPPDIAIPHFGYKAHTGIDKGHRFIRRWDVTDASRHDGRMLRRGMLDRTNTGATVWADSAYRSKANEAFMAKHGFASQVHHRKPPGGRWRRIFGAATTPARSTERRSSMSLLIRNRPWACSYAPSGSPGRGLRSGWPISPTTCAAWSSSDGSQPRRDQHTGQPGRRSVP